MQARVQKRTNMPEPITFACRLDQGHAGLRLDQVAAALLPEYSRARLQAWIRAGCLTLDGQAARPALRVSGGEMLRLKAEPELEASVPAQDIPLQILAEDRFIIVLNKPAGLVVHPAAGNPDGTLQNALLHHDPDLAAIPRAGIVHRLDKDTTGLMVVARSFEAHASLVAQLQARKISRVYEALVTGLAAGPGTVDAPIGRNPRDRQKMAVVATGKPAVSHFRVLRRFRHFSHLEVSLESGRTHQIRVHMQHIGLPLIGDQLYGRKAGRRKGLSPAVLDAVRAFPRQALHARTLRLKHPGSGEPAEYHAPLPADMAGLLGVLGAEDA
jgi:23S rRNA pseudouridine1911/1915/1917 synthase